MRETGKKDSKFIASMKIKDVRSTINLDKIEVSKLKKTHT